MTNTTNEAVVLETQANGLSVRGNAWRAAGIAVAQLDSCTAWVADTERRAIRRKRPEMAPWVR